MEDSSSESGHGEGSGEEEEEDGGKKDILLVMRNSSTYSVKLSLSWFQLCVALYGLSIFLLYNIEHLPVCQKRILQNNVIQN